MKSTRITLYTAACLVGLALILAPPPAAADHVIYDDLIVDASACVGWDCANGESFGYDTFRLKENNLRIHFWDTSSGSFPTTDWRIIINDSTSGGGGYFGVEDSDAGRIPFRIEANAPAHSLYVEDYGRVGFGTSVPFVELHIKDGDTPTVRLDQDGTAGWGAQAWDLAGNETNFFVRDVTNGSTLPFRIRPGAPTSSIDISDDGYVGIGTASPDEELHVEGSTDAVIVKMEGTGVNAGFELVRDSETWRNTINSAGQLTFSENGNVRVTLDDNTGNLTIDGGLITTGGGGACTVADPCDGVFSPGFAVESIDEHSDYMWSNRHLKGIGPTPENGPINITRKTGGLINELEKAHIYIEQLNNRLKAENAALRAELEALKALVSTLVD